MSHFCFWVPTAFSTNLHWSNLAIGFYSVICTCSWARWYLMRPSLTHPCIPSIQVMFQGHSITKWMNEEWPSKDFRARRDPSHFLVYSPQLKKKIRYRGGERPCPRSLSGQERSQDLNINPIRVQAQTLFWQTRLPLLFPHWGLSLSSVGVSWLEWDTSKNLPAPKFYETSSHVSAHKFMWPLDPGHSHRLTPWGRSNWLAGLCIPRLFIHIPFLLWSRHPCDLLRVSCLYSSLTSPKLNKKPGTSHVY